MIHVADLFKIGIGPSSSHTVGPMVASNQFIEHIEKHYQISDITQIDIELYGSLASTGKGHATDKAVLLGLLGHHPKTIDTQFTEDYLIPIMENQRLNIAGKHKINFDYDKNLQWYGDTVLAYHPNALVLKATFNNGEKYQQTYYSIGGGFVMSAEEIEQTELQGNIPNHDEKQPPYPYSTAKELLELCEKNQLSISELVMANELAFAEKADILQYLDDIWQVMESCVRQGLKNDGVLPGGLNVKRRAKKLHQQLQDEFEQANTLHDKLSAMDWVDLYALAVNEENANGGKVVTAPTNGAAGIIPAVMHYYRDFIPSFNQQGVYDFLLTATAIGSLIKKNASISGAEVGCQGEVGSACAMASGGLAQVLGGTPAQCLNASEIGLEHNLGLTCDPIDGLVQVPCIERNAMGAVKAINATRLALRGDGTHFVCLDKAIETMRETGKDMNDKYKETAKGGLAIHAHNRIATATLGVSVNYSQC